MTQKESIHCRPGITDALQRLEAENRRLKNDIEGNKRTISKLKDQLLKAQKRAADAGDEARSYKHQMLAERKRAEDLECVALEYQECAIESQGWDWLSAQEAAEEQGKECYDIDEMQRLYEIAHNIEGGSND